MSRDELSTPSEHGSSPAAAGWRREVEFDVCKHIQHRIFACIEAHAEELGANGATELALAYREEADWLEDLSSRLQQAVSNMASAPVPFSMAREGSDGTRKHDDGRQRWPRASLRPQGQGALAMSGHSELPWRVEFGDGGQVNGVVDAGGQRVVLASREDAHLIAAAVSERASLLKCEEALREARGTLAQEGWTDKGLEFIDSALSQLEDVRHGK